jgi:hypothetical protein
LVTIINEATLPKKSGLDLLQSLVKGS